MAMSANPFDEFLNAEVDERTISALVGTLESQLASPTDNAHAGKTPSTPLNANHVNRPLSGNGGLQLVRSETKPNHPLNSNSVIVNKGGPVSSQIHSLNSVKSIGSSNAPRSSFVVTTNANVDGGMSIGGTIATGLPRPNSIISQTSNGSPGLQTNIVNTNINNRTVVLKPGINVDSSVVGSMGAPVAISTDGGLSLSSSTLPPPVLNSKDSIKQGMQLKTDQKLFGMQASSVPPGVHFTSPVSRPQTVSYVRTPSTNQIPVHRLSLGGNTTQLQKLAPRIVPGAPIRIGTPHQTQMISPRPGTNPNTITLPAGLPATPGMVLIKNEQGQIVTVLHNPGPASTMTMTPSTPSYKVQTAIKPGMPMSMHSTGTPQPIAVRSSVPQIIHGPVGQQQPAVHTPPNLLNPPKSHTHVAELENVKKCKNFLTTLIKLASSQPKETVENVKNLIQGLIDGEVEPEAFTTKLQIELKSNPQPYLVPFLKKSLPMLRYSLANRKMEIDGVRPPKVPMIKTPISRQIPTVVNTPRGIRPNAVGLNKTLFKSPTATATTSSSSASAHRLKKYDPLKDDDDINDVAAMGGVNINEESRNILAANAELLTSQTRSCKDEYFLNHGPLFQRILAAAQKHGIKDVPPEVAHLVSHATQERLRNIVERLSVIAEHRLEIYRVDKRYEATSDVKSQLKFLEEIDKLEKKRHEEYEREKLLRAAKSRSKHEDPEQLKLKQKAKEMQQMELEETRQREANLTALAAIGPRKKRKVDTSDSSSNAVGSPFGAGIGSSSQRQMSLRPRIKRVNLRDLVFLMEQERESCKSNSLFKAFLK